MLRKIYATGTVGIILLACVGFAVGFAVSYRLVQRTPDAAGPGAPAPLGSDRETDGLSGPVNRVRTEVAKLSLNSGSLVEEPRALLELTSYDLKGKRIDNSYYLVPRDSQAGREEYAYDDRGNVRETTRRDEGARILGKEVYAYEYDALGNWVKMVASTVVYEGGRVTQQPTEVTYRTINYYFDQAIAQIVGSSPPGAAGASAGDDRTQLRGALDAWVAATNARDLEKVMAFYGPEVEVFYRARNVDREFVRDDKARSFERAEAMEVSAAEPEITVADDGRAAEMVFRKKYAVKVRGRERRGEVLQLLRWRRAGSRWEIVGERDLRVLRKS
ncbi:MAG TPA: nuclear transport factor 2 family protein [Pyrinomonadaceae bacterium]|nr:nuclear transport factor 2 family protein [Pyrinomonadaceae bacterium]